MYSYMKSKARLSGKVDNKPTPGAFGKPKFLKNCEHKRKQDMRDGSAICLRCEKILKKGK